MIDLRDKQEVIIDPVTVLEQKMVKMRACHKVLRHILEAEYVAGTSYDADSLKKLILRKRNCANRFESLVASTNAQIGRMTRQKMPAAMPDTLAGHVKMIQGLTPDQQETLVGLANDLEQRHEELMSTAARNALMFKRVIARLAAASRYVDHKGYGERHEQS
nr:hypothetical protein [uncultured Desulfobacter sp.]